MSTRLVETTMEAELTRLFAGLVRDAADLELIEDLRSEGSELALPAPRELWQLVFFLGFSEAIVHPSGRYTLFGVDEFMNANDRSEGASSCPDGVFKFGEQLFVDSHGVFGEAGSIWKSKNEGLSERTCITNNLLGFLRDSSSA